ncbi:MAG: hypothetical protein ACRCZO_04920 [Cetobacterium sp.]
MIKKIKLRIYFILFLYLSTFLNCATGPNSSGTSIIQVDVSITLKDRGGIIITPTPDGLINEDIVLDHGIFLATSDSGSIAEKKIYIKNTLGVFPTGTNISIKLDSDVTNKNNLNNLNNVNHMIPHTLQISPLENLQLISLGEASLIVSGEKITDFKEYAVGNNGNPILNIKSTVESGNIKEKAIGIYRNQSKITISFIK